ncbi:uncharacterized protein LOC144135118 [Amblyomma americanum]
MAVLATLLTVLAALHVSSGDEHPFKVSTGPCLEVPSVDWTESINAYLRRIPNNVTLPGILATSQGEFLDFGRCFIFGLGNLWPYKHYHSYCINKETFIEVIAFAREPLAAEMEWRSCSGSTGLIGTKVSSSKLRLIFRALTTSDNPTRVELFKIYGDSLENPWVYVTGAPTPLMPMISVVNTLLKPHIREIWGLILGADAQALIRDHCNE